MLSYLVIFSSDAFVDRLRWATLELRALLTARVPDDNIMVFLWKDW